MFFIKIFQENLKQLIGENPQQVAQVESQVEQTPDFKILNEKIN